MTKQKTVVSATFNKIIEYITSPEGGTSFPPFPVLSLPSLAHITFIPLDIATRKLILATYRSWTTPDKLFVKLLQRFFLFFFAFKGTVEFTRDLIVFQVMLCRFLSLNNRKWEQRNSQI